MQAKGTWVLVADGARARILRGVQPLQDKTGHDAVPEGEREITFEAEHVRASDLASDKPGRSFASAGARRSSMEMPSDPVRLAKRSFASTLADELHKYKAAGDFDQLALIAPPQILGDLRDILSAPVKEAIVAEFAKDLTNMPAQELRSAVIKLLREHQAG